MLIYYWLRNDFPIENKKNNNHYINNVGKNYNKFTILNLLYLLSC